MAGWESCQVTATTAPEQPALEPHEAYGEGIPSHDKTEGISRNLASGIL